MQQEGERVKKRDAFLIAMLEATTTKQAWEMAGISRTTAYQYLGDKSFKKELQDRRNDIEPCGAIFGMGI